MIYIPRLLESKLQKLVLESGKAIILYGPRQVGKTTLVKSVLANLSLRTLEINCDEQRYIDTLSSADGRKLKELVEGYDLLFVDEAQRVKNIGLSLKILIDQATKLKIIVTGSSSLELASGVPEPLTGRKWTYNLFPVSQQELRALYNPFELKEQLGERLVWGSYPEIFRLKGVETKAKYLAELSTDYLYKDIFKLVNIRNPDKIRNLLKLIAFQVGSEVSLNELGNSLDMSKETVARYIDLLKKNFILFELSPLSRNLRKEVTKTKKYYF
ncbi:MAG: ATP-binding protein, partial [Candidatus Dadabacteria bacterium]